MKPLLSIVIPTKNRYEYLTVLLKALLANDSTKFEIIVQDNSDDNSEFLEFVRKLNDGKLKYNYTGGWLSVIDNCDIAVDAASGEYVCMLGDDDGILIEQSLHIVKFLSNNSYDAALFNKAQYYWPDTAHAVWGETLSGKVFYEKNNFKKLELDARKELLQVLKQGASKNLGMLPRVYHAFVSIDALKSLKEKTGTYFPGPSPDMANAVGLVPFINRYIYIDFPAVISGHSTKSTGGQGGEKKHHGSIENQKHLPIDTKEKWSNKIPFFWSGPTVYAESARRALVATNNTDIQYFDYSTLYAMCLVFQSEYLRETASALQRSPFLLIKVLFKSIFLFLNRVTNFIENNFQYKIAKKKHPKAKDISIAVDIMNNFMPVDKLKF